jgi:hypothetical protein
LIKGGQDLDGAGGEIDRRNADGERIKGWKKFRNVGF